MSTSRPASAFPPSYRPIPGISAAPWLTPAWMKRASITSPSTRSGSSDYRLDRAYDMVFLIGGAVVPGRYLGSKIGTAAEIRRITEHNPGQRFAVGGLISHVLTGGGNVILVHNDIEKFAFTAMPAAKRPTSGAPPMKSPAGPSRAPAWSATTRAFPTSSAKSRPPAAAPGKATAPSAPRASTGQWNSGRPEISSPRSTRSSRRACPASGWDARLIFCSTSPTARPSPGGSRNRRCRRYGSSCRSCAAGKNGASYPVLNIDNANPGTIANFPEESSLILEELVDTITPGDTMALGVESFDEEVVRKNNLKVPPGTRSAPSRSSTASAGKGWTPYRCSFRA